MRVLVCGGRDFASPTWLDRVLDQLHDVHEFTALIHGGARGVDSLAGAWALRAKVPVERYPADWSRHGRGAGAIRNQQMLTEAKPDLVVAFPGGRGTADMVGRAQRAGVKVAFPAAWP